MSPDHTAALDLIIRVTALLGIAAGIAWALHRRPAAVRHQVWLAALGGAVLLAVVVPWAPRLDVPVLRAAPRTPVVAAPERSPITTTSAVRSEELPVQERSTFSGGLSAGRFDAIRAPGLTAANVWLAGTALVLLWGLFGRIGLARIGRRAVRITRGPWHDVATRTSASLRIRRPVSLLLSGDVASPMTWGVFRPHLILPTASMAWSDALRASVAAHELSHIARRDYGVQLMAFLACAVYWFHPGVWMAARKLRQEAERACDDQVLGLGTDGEEYASHLIGIARVSRMHRLTGAVAIGMARPSTLEGRIVAVLDATRARGSVTARSRAAISGLALAVFVPVGVVQPVPSSGAPVSTSLLPVEVPATVVNPTAASTTTVPVQGRDSIIERSFNVLRGGTLVLDLDSGGDVTVTGWDEPRVTVRARLAGEDWRDIEFDATRDDDVIRVVSRFGRRSNYQSSSNDFEVRVPRRFDVRLASAGGGLRITNVEGTFSGRTGGGDLAFERLRGSARVTTGGGTIVVSDSDLSGSVSTGGGMVRLSNVRGGLRGSSGSGPVIYGEGTGVGTSDLSSVSVGRDGSRISVGRGTTSRAGMLNIEKAGGNVDLDTAPEGARVHTGGGDVSIGPSGGDVRASTGGGDIRIGPARGSVRAVTGAGTIHIVVDRDRAIDQVINVSSGYGRVVIELPSDFSGRLDLETAHTRTHEQTARITSDWDIEREPLTDWSDRAGTPRRYLRATASLGGRGSGARVIVRTVNGEIEIRRR